MGLIFEGGVQWLVALLTYFFTRQGEMGFSRFLRFLGISDQFTLPAKLPNFSGAQGYLSGLPLPWGKNYTVPTFGQSRLTLGEPLQVVQTHSPPPRASQTTNPWGHTTAALRSPPPVPAEVGGDRKCRCNPRVWFLKRTRLHLINRDVRIQTHQTFGPAQEGRNEVGL